MAKKNHRADIQNPNKGTPGTNTTYDKNQGNRGFQKKPLTSSDTGRSGTKKDSK